MYIKAMATVKGKGKGKFLLAEDVYFEAQDQERAAARAHLTPPEETITAE